VSKSAKNVDSENSESLPKSDLQSYPWKRFLKGPDSELLDNLYIPMLARAVRYDRCCAYFSSSVLAAAARGFGQFIQRLEQNKSNAKKPSIRLLVNEELTQEDVQAMMETRDLGHLERVIKKRFKNPQDALQKKRLQMLAWLVKKEYLEVKVGVMRQGSGIVHAKFGISYDEAGNAIVFNGSGNESAKGLQANYERLEVSTSWEDEERLKEYSSEIDTLWNNEHPDVYTVPLPEAIRLKLIKFAPKEPPILEPSGDIHRQKAVMLLDYIIESPFMANGGEVCDATTLVDLWPHQRHVIEEATNAWPEGRLLCDEVGMGKTIEAILILRRLMAGRGVKRALILLPAGLLKQWQAELREKGGMIFPRLEGTNTLIWPDDKVERLPDLKTALQQDVLILSRETARTDNNLSIIMDAEPWDLVILDESHAARRKRQEEGEFNSPNLLLSLLRNLQLHKQAKGILLLSATPMKTHPWEPWDLLSVLGVGGEWLADFSGVRAYYDTIAGVENGKCSLDSARRTAGLLKSEENIVGFNGLNPSNISEDQLARKISFTTLSMRSKVASWLRKTSPLARHMHRNTRATLRRYYEAGLLSDPPPRRDVRDLNYDFQDQEERALYNSVTKYINKRFDEIESDRPGKGFVMTIYRRRASSSPLALQRSLLRRKEGLQKVIDKRAYFQDLQVNDMPEAIDSDDLPEEMTTSKIPASLPQDPAVARSEMIELNSILETLTALGNTDSKRDYFFDILRSTTDDGRAALVFTQYTDTMEYLRDHLVGSYGKSLGCYSGDGGQIWDGDSWHQVTKDTITTALKNGEIRVLVSTDAASEGLNLQAASVVINYDLPWNPSKVEQRIGRIDRIGQNSPKVIVVNLYLEKSVDDRVYRALRKRCGLFEKFVGAMQPVLSIARKMLLGQDDVDLSKIEMSAEEIEQDSISEETYFESLDVFKSESKSPLNRAEISNILENMGDVGKVRFKKGKRKNVIEVVPRGGRKQILSTDLKTIESDVKVRSISPFEPTLKSARDFLKRPGERLPLVIGSNNTDSFRCCKALWVEEGKTREVNSIKQLIKLTSSWDGEYPKPSNWVKAREKANTETSKLVIKMAKSSDDIQGNNLEQQIRAAHLRLKKELGKYLLCLPKGGDDLNQILHQQISRDIASAKWLKRALNLLGGYPDWSLETQNELEQFVRSLSENQRSARLLGREVQAAIDDPRWIAKNILNS